MGANAMRSRYGWLNWDIVDPLTAGPLDSVVLAWPQWLGLDITLFNIRLTGVLLTCLTVSFLFGATRRVLGNVGAMVATFPLYMFLVFTNHGDFIHYTSELLPILLISIGVFGLFASLSSGRMIGLYPAALALGCTPFAKLQGTPIAAVVGVFVVMAASRGAGLPVKSRAIRAVKIIVVALVPAVLFLTPLALGGGFEDFVKSYFVQQKLRIDGQVWTDRVPGMLRSTSFGWLAASYSSMGLVILAVFFENFMSRRDRSLSNLQIWMVALAALMLPATYFAVAGPGRDFAHYLIFCIPALWILGAVCLALIGSSWGGDERSRGNWFGVTAAIAVIVLLPAMAKERAQDPNWSSTWLDGMSLQGEAFKSPRLLQWLRPDAGDEMLCWGWRPECYLDAGMAPATREATNENQLYNTALRPYFRDRFLFDFVNSPPSYIVDAVAPGSFHFVDKSVSGIEAFPDLRDIIDEDYALVSSVVRDDECPRVYADRSRAARLASSRIEFAQIISAGSAPGTSHESVDDGSTFESCPDYWLAPQGKAGALDLPFKQPSPVKRILILNTRNGFFDDRSSRIVRLALRLDGKEIWTRFVELDSFPRWTSIVLDEPVLSADALHIDVLAYWGYSGGLNEVKVYRD